MQHFRRLATTADFWVAILAALVYSSWPLGFLLNPSVAEQDFASQLEARRQPYNWVFISLDILAGLLLCWLGARQWRATRRYSLLRFSVLCYVLFGLFVIMAAIAPDDCSTQRVCHTALYDPLVIIHGFASIVSVGLLLIGLLLPIVVLWKKHHFDWIVLLLVFILLGWGLAGIGTLLVMAHGLRSNWLQYDFITVCSMSIVVCMAIVAHLSTADSRRLRRR